MDYKDYTGVATEILNNVGGKENVANLTHCVTRLRFTLCDDNLVNRNELQKIPLVMAIIEKSGQFQVVIGNKVVKVFNELVPKLDLHEDSEDVKTKRMGLFDTVTAFVSGVFIPVLSLLTASGVLKGILSCLSVAGILDSASQTSLVLAGIADVIFYFFPIILGASTARYLKMDMFIGMAIGGALIYPTFVAASGDGSIHSFLGIGMKMSNYSSTVFPVIIAVIAAYWFQKPLKKIIPDMVQYIFVPLITLIVVIPLTFWLIGPAITHASSILASAILTIYNISPIIAGLVIGGPWILCLMLGLHWAFIPIFIMNIAENGSEPLMGLMAGNQLAMAGAALGVFLLLKNKQKKSLCFANSITCFLGISEPTIYGILLPLKKPFIISIIIGSIGGAMGGFFRITIYNFGASGLLGIPSMVGPDGIDTAFIGGLFTMAFSAIASCIVTYVVMKKDQNTILEYDK